ncbi:MAG: DUF6364 family protein [Bifidobacteriaceae bacterium]|jgi:hypothetical protein|nr:DUF6364 family protein [Bifidobacteriaceae bacterium]
MVKNVTLTLDEDVLRRARILAAQRETSVSGLVGELLGQAVGDPRPYQDVWAAQERIMAEGSGLRLGGRPLTREEAHQR